MLLLDENLSPKLVARINDAYPGSLHVLHSRLDNSPDIEVWRYAKKQKLTIVTKDKDFLHYAIQHGYPPKLVYLTTGNAKLFVIESILLETRTCCKTLTHSHATAWECILAPENGLYNLSCRTGSAWKPLFSHT